MEQPPRDLEGNMHDSPGEENKATQGVADNRHLGHHHREEETERPDQPDAGPSRETRTAEAILGDKQGGEAQRKERQEKVHRGAH